MACSNVVKSIWWGEGGDARGCYFKTPIHVKHPNRSTNNNAAYARYPDHGMDQSMIGDDRGSETMGEAKI